MSARELRSKQEIADDAEQWRHIQPVEVSDLLCVLAPGECIKFIGNGWRIKLVRIEADSAFELWQGRGCGPDAMEDKKIMLEDLQYSLTKGWPAGDALIRVATNCSPPPKPAKQD